MGVMNGGKAKRRRVSPSKPRPSRTARIMALTTAEVGAGALVGRELGTGGTISRRRVWRRMDRRREAVLILVLFLLLVIALLYFS